MLSGVAIMSQENRFSSALALAVLMIVAAVFVANQVAFAQAQAAPSAQASSPEIHAVLEKIVHPKKVKVGDEVVARMTEPTKLTKRRHGTSEGNPHCRQSDRSEDEG